MSGALTTPHPLATAAGMAILRAGGTAPEALVAAGAMLAVVMPHFCGLGGDSVWLLADRSGENRCFLAIGHGISQPMPTAPIPLRGASSILTTAALVDGWGHAFRYAHQQLGGRSRWEDLLSPAITAARDGVAVSPSQAFWGAFRKAEAATWHGFQPIYMAGDNPLPAGHWLRQPDLASSLEEIATHGPAAFYRGALGGRIVAGLRAAGVDISAQDLASTRTTEERPLAIRYRGLTLLAPPPPTQGVTTLQIMGILSRFDLSSVLPGSADHLHLCVEATKRAFLERGKIADTDTARNAAAQWISAQNCDALASGISMSAALPWPYHWQQGDTVFLGAIDGQGNAASVLQSTYFDWGSGVVVGDTGIIWQNRGAAFSTDPGHPNAFKPGKRPFYTLNPGIALADERPRFVYGTQGADGQPQTLSMLLTRLIDFGQSPQDALSGPRFLLGRTFSDDRDSLKLEADVPKQTQAELAARGHQISVIPAQSPIAGQAGIVSMTPQGVEACHDPRH
jgi:gamma-glutamyltranspeptidase